MKTLALALALTALAPLAAVAQDGRGADRGEQVTTHTFSDADEVRGGTVGPEGALVGTHRRKVFTTLIRPREHYRQELLRSVEVL